jgi:hypothetical protein
MMPMSLIRSLICIAALGSVGACATKEEPPPNISLDGRNCAASPDLTSAKPVPLDPDKAVTVTFDTKSTCLEAAGKGKSVYAAFQLPSTNQSYVLSVTSSPLGEGLFSPQLQLLGLDGKVLRTIDRDTFLFHGNALYAGIRAHQDEQYLIVASDPATVGQRISRLQEGTSAYTAVSNGIAVTIHTGYEATPTYTYAHNGLVTVAAQPTPKAQ